MGAFLHKNNGIALVTSLMLTLISLVMIMMVMTLITNSISRSGSQKRYKSAVEAAYGGSDVVLNEMIPFLLSNKTETSLDTLLKDKYDSGWLATTSVLCLQDKLTKSTGAWNSSCEQSLDFKSPDTKKPDFVFDLKATNGSPYTVYARIVDSVIGNTRGAGELQLEGGGVTESGSVLAPMHIPSVFRIEIQGQRKTNATEQANLSVLYAY